MQLKTLEAAYQARKEMAEKNNLDATELDKAYFRAKEQLESEHQQKILAIRNQYGLSTQQERFNAELEQLRLAREQQLLTEKEYEQAVQNLKRDSYKKQFDYYSNLFQGQYRHFNRLKWITLTPSMTLRSKQPKEMRKK